MKRMVRHPRLLIAGSVLVVGWSAILAGAVPHVLAEVARILLALAPLALGVSSLAATGLWFHRRRKARGPRPPRGWRRDDAVSVEAFRQMQRTASYCLWLACQHCPPHQVALSLADTDPEWRAEANATYRLLQGARLTHHNPQMAVWACDVLDGLHLEDHSMRFPG